METPPGSAPPPAAAFVSPRGKEKYLRASKRGRGVMVCPHQATVCPQVGWLGLWSMSAQPLSGVARRVLFYLAEGWDS